MEGWITLGAIAVVFVLLLRNWASPDVAMLSAAVFLGVIGVLDTGQVFEGLANPGVIAIAALFVVAAAMRETGALDALGTGLLGGAHNERSVLLRMAASVAPMSAFLNNTPVVAMMAPVLCDWCRKHGVSPSKLLIPLSYLAIIGGTCTLIGTSTTIVVNGLMEEERLGNAGAAWAGALRPIGMFEVSAVGIPLAVLVVLYILFIGRRLLPDRRDLLDSHGASARSYLIDMLVQPDCKLAGKTVEEAGLRHLAGLFLVEIGRGDGAISPVRPDEVLCARDILTFTGVVATIVDLERIPGLVPIADEGYTEKAADRREKALVEAVISATSPRLGRSVRDADFRTVYNAAVIAVHRGGQRLSGRVGDVILRDGDTLLLQAGPHFVRAHRNNPDFYLVSGVHEAWPVRNDKMVLAIMLLAGLIALMSMGRNVGISVPLAAALVAGLMVITQCISPAAAAQSVDWRMLMTIVGAIALGKALQETGVAGEFAGFLVSSTANMGPYVLLGVIYVLTSVLTECVTTKGSAVLMFPIAVAAAVEAGVSPRPFVFAVLFAAAASFVTPLGYQTNLMVFGPGGYRFSDYFKVGLPLSIIITCAAIYLIPRVWGF